MPALPGMLGNMPDRYVAAALSDDGLNTVGIAAQAATLSATEFYLHTVSALYAWDGAAPARLLAEADNHDNLAVVTGGVLRTVAELYGYDGAAWDRVQTGGDSADDVTPVTGRLLRTLTSLYGFDGTNWDRVRTRGSGALVVNPSRTRAAVVTHRNAITTADVLASPGNPTLTDRSADGGTLTANTQYFVAVASVKQQPTGTSTNVIGVTPINATIQNVTTANDGNNAHRIRVAWAQVTNADAYLLFLSTDAAPRLVGYITEAQRAAGGLLNAVFGTPAAGGVAGAIDVGVVGTGLQTSSPAFAFNTAHMPDIVNGGGAGSVFCAGYETAYLHVQAAMSKTTVWSVLPSLTLIPWLLDQGASAGDWYAGSALSPVFMNNIENSMEMVYAIDVKGATKLVVTIAQMTGLASVTILVELV